MSGQGFGRSLRAVPYWPCTVQIFVRYEIRDPKEYFLKFWAESIQPLSSSCHFKNYYRIERLREDFKKWWLYNLHFSRFIIFFLICRSTAFGVDKKFHIFYPRTYEGEGPLAYNYLTVEGCLYQHIPIITIIVYLSKHCQY